MDIRPTIADGKAKGLFQENSSSMVVICPCGGMQICVWNFWQTGIFYLNLVSQY
jgi:hypothetical protein